MKTTITKLILALLLSASSAFAADFSTDASGMTAVNSGTNEREFFTGAPFNAIIAAASASQMTVEQRDTAQRLVEAAGALLAQDKLLHLTDYHTEEAGVSLSMSWFLEPDYLVPSGYRENTAVGVYVTLTATIQDPETWVSFDELIRDWYDASPWQPDPAGVPLGQAFTQSKTQLRDWRKGERSNLGNERNVTTYNTQQTVTQQALGTKPKTAPIITWSAPSAITYGTRLSAAQLNASANTSGVFSYSPGENTTLNAGALQPLTVTFTPDDLANYSTATATQTITVTQAATTLTITAPTPSPRTLPIDSESKITTALRRDHDALSLSTATVTLVKGAATGTAAGTLAGNVLTMTQGAGNDTITINAAYPGDSNHLPSSTSITFRVPVAGNVVFGHPTPIISPIILPGAFMFHEHGPTSSTFDVQLHNTGELAASLDAVAITPGTSATPSFILCDTQGVQLSLPVTVPAGGVLPLKIRFHPAKWQVNQDSIKLTWSCRPNTTTLASGETSFELQGTGLKPILATLPRGSVADPNNPRDLAGQWPTLKSQ